MWTLYFHPVVSSSPSFFLSSSPNLSGRRLDVYHTSTHGVALVQFRMQIWNVLHAAHWKYRPQKNRHLHTIAQFCRTVSLQLRHISTAEKKLVKQQYLFHMSPQYGELRPTNGWHFGCLGDPTNFNGFHVLAALLHGTLVVGVSQTLRNWTEDATYIRQAAIMLGIGPHSSLICSVSCSA